MTLKKKKKHLSREYGIVVNDYHNGGVVESYNRLRDNILYYSLDGKNRVIQVESSVSGEGKTVLLANLAVALSQAGKKVVVIDMDFRRARIHRPFKVENINGITDYLLGKIDKKTMIKETSFGVDLINRGSKVENTTSIITSEKVKTLINELKEIYDYILIDCPPVLAVSDYIHIGQIADCCIFTVAHGITKKAQVKEAITELKKNNINVIGCVYTFYNELHDQYSYNYRYGNKYGYTNYQPDSK